MKRTRPLPGEYEKVKRCLLVVPLLLVSLCAAAADFGDYLLSAQVGNEDFQALTIDLELGKLRYQKSKIEAVDDLESLAADSAFCLVQSSYRQSLQSFYLGVLDAVYGAALTDLTLRIALGNEEIAHDDETAAAQRVRSGMSPQSELIDAQTTVRSATVESETQRWQRGDAQDTLTSVTGLSLEDLELPGIQTFTIELTEEQWVDLDFAVKRAKVQAQISESRFDRLPPDVSQFDRKLAQTELDKARVAVRKAEVSSKNAYQSIVRQLSTQAEIIVIRTDELKLNQSFQQEAETSYRRGMMTVADRKRADVRVLTARSNLIQAQQAYAQTFIKYIVVAGIAPDEML